MSEIISFPLPVGPNYTIPDVGDVNWGQAVTNYLVAIPSGVVPTSGTFTLTGDVSFGASFGLVSKYFKSVSSNIASTGVVRLAHSDTVAFRNFANSADLLLAVDGADNLTFNGSTFGTGGAVNPGLANQLAYYPASSDAVSGLTSITASRVLRSDSNGLPIALAAITALKALASDASGFPVASATTATELGYVSGVTSPIQTQLDGKQASGTYVTSVTGTANQINSTGGTAPVLSLSSTVILPGTLQLGGDENANSHKITNLTSGSAAQDAATFSQIKVIQFIQSSTSTPFATTNSAYQTSNLTATITPTSASNRILIFATGPAGQSASNHSNYLSLFRGSTDLSGGAAFQEVYAPLASATWFPCAFAYLDSPATTSPITYSVKLRTDGAGTSTFGDTNVTQYMNLIEVV